MPKKAKVSRPIVYTLLGAAVIGTLVFLNQPDATTAKHIVKLPHTAKTDANGISEEDLNAHFARYTGGARDPFVAGVVPVNPNSAPNPLASGGKSGWVLTGVNQVNGVDSALVENGTDSVFLKVGDTWNGLHVVSIQQDDVQLVNALGQKTDLTFAAPPDDKSTTGTLPSGTTVTADGNNPAVPDLSSIEPLPAITSNYQGRSRRRSRGRFQSGDQTPQSTEGTNEQ